MLTKENLNRSEEGIDISEFYLALVTNNMLNDEKCIYEWNYAKLRHKPFILIVKKGAVIPKDMLKDINVVLECEWKNKRDLELAGNKINEVIKFHGRQI